MNISDRELDRWIERRGRPARTTFVRLELSLRILVAA
jgi:hypothetical protein